MDKFIALDIGNVCFNIDKNSWIHKLNSNYTDELKVKVEELWINFEKGEFTQELFLSELMKLSDKSLTKYDLITIFSTVISKEIKGMKDIIEKIVINGYKVVFFSDTSILHLNEIRSKLSFSYLIVGGVFSFETGFFKPAKENFAEFERRYGRPELFIDDLEQNCRGAMEYGWNTHLFVSTDKLYERLIKDEIIS